MNGANGGLVKILGSVIGGIAVSGLVGAVVLYGRVGVVETAQANHEDLPMHDPVRQEFKVIEARLGELRVALINIQANQSMILKRLEENSR